MDVSICTAKKEKSRQKKLDLIAIKCEKNDCMYLKKECLTRGLTVRIYLDFTKKRDNTVSMSRLSIKTFCIEKYADYKSVPSNEIFRLFEQNNILKMLDDDYNILHGHGFNYVLHDIEQIIENGGL